MYYYKRSMKSYNNMEYNLKKNQLALNYKFGIQGLLKKIYKNLLNDFINKNDKNLSSYYRFR